MSDPKISWPEFHHWTQWFGADSVPFTQYFERLQQQRINKAFVDEVVRSARQLEPKVLDLKEELVEKGVADKCVSMAKGVLLTIAAASQYALGSPKSEVAPQLHDAAVAFDSSLGGDVMPTGQVTGQLTRRLEHFKRMTELQSRHPGTLGFWMAWDLLERLAPEDSAKSPEVENAAVSTPVLLVLVKENKKVGIVNVLKLERITGQGTGLIPDVFSMGCVAIDVNEPSPADNFHRSLLRVWKLSKLEVDGVRVRWSIRPLNEFVDEDEDKFEYLHGRSLEAAVLAGLWALRGGIPGDDAFQQSEPMLLETKVAITASLAPYDEPPDDLKQVGLTGVGGTDSKLDAAAHPVGERQTPRLDTVLLAEAEKNDSTREAAINLERKVAEEKQLAYSGLTIHRVKTIGEALDFMLVTNRYLKKYQEKIDDDWNEQWLDGSGKYVVE